MNHLSAVITKHDQGIQDPKRRGCHNEDVDRRNVGHVVVQEATPSRGRGFGPAPQVSSNRGLADLDAELEQFAVDTGRAPERVGEAHLADQITDFGTHLGPSGTARSPPPIDPKAFAMPLDHGCRLDQHHGIEDLRPNPEKPKPEKSVRGEEPNPTWVLPTQDAHLMPQANQLELQDVRLQKN